MKLYSSNLSTLLNRPAQIPKFLLIYGPDEAEAMLINGKIINAIKKANSDTEIMVTKIPYATLRDNPRMLYEETQSVSLFGDKKLLIIEGMPATVGKDLLAIMATLLVDIPIIFQAGDLAKSSSARRYFEDSDKCAAIGCYKPDVVRIKQIITTFIRNHNLTLDNEALEILASMLTANEAIILAELEKLYIYTKGNNTITVDDIYQVIAQGHEFSLDNLCESIVKNDKNALTRELYRLELAGENAVFIIRVLINFFFRALKVKLSLDMGKSQEAALAQLRPPAFFKGRSNLLLASKQLSISLLEGLVHKLTYLELQCKKGGINPELRMNFMLHLLMEPA